MNHKFAVVILAAGSSGRLGRPKQLLPYLGRTLVEHAARTALASGAHDVVVVVGSDGEAVREKLKGLAVRVVSNSEWSLGIGSSIRVGIGALRPETECAVVALCDQPQITPTLLRSLAHRHFESGLPIVASSYDGVIGAPTAFGPSQFAKLMALPANKGARDLIRQSAFVLTVEFSGGNVDVDIPATTWRPILFENSSAPRNQFRKTEDVRGPPVATFSSLSAA